jgi:hypothetical protein
VACDAEQLFIGGKPVEFGDGVLVYDEESDACWRASIRDSRGSEVLVHFTGCDDGWDEWIDVKSNRLIRMDSTEKAKEKSGAFQSDTLEETIDDQELLEQYRKQRWEENARWQLNCFAQAQLGEWEGTIELYELDASGRVCKLPGGPEPCSSNARVSDTNTIELVDTVPAVATTLALDTLLSVPSFQPEAGTMAVANAFSLAETRSTGNGASQLLELAIREESQRVRCKLLYVPEPLPIGGLRLSSLGILREATGGEDFVTPNADADVDGAPGRGLYDPPPGLDKSQYVNLYCEAGITLAFPTVVPDGAGGCVSLDWVAGNMRYQIDRKFEKLDGSLSSLELTEIRKDDAETRPPDFPHQGGGSA